MTDVRDILELEGAQSPVTKEAIVGNKTKRYKKPAEPMFKRPEGMHRELYALLYSDQRDPPSLTPTDSSQGYRRPKAKLGRSRARNWGLVPFTNPAREDELVLYHWRRAGEETKDYAFAKFNKVIDVPDYTDEEYELYLNDEPDKWSKEETDHLFDLCRRFDLRFIIIHDRYDKETFRVLEALIHSKQMSKRCYVWTKVEGECVKERSVEDLKERYYALSKRLIKARALPGMQPPELPPDFDAQHERNRKTQLLKLFNRTPEQVDEEEMLVAELKKIELRKKEREKKQQDLQKLITAAENKPSAVVPKPVLVKKDKKQSKKKQKRKSESQAVDPKNNKDSQAGIKFPEIKGAGVYLRSTKLKMPQSVGTKKTKATEQLLDELGVDLVPMPTEKICKQFNELRNDLILLYELRQALGNCEFELQSLKHKYESLEPGKDVAALIGFNLEPPTQDESQRKRRTAAALMESNPWKKARKV